MLKSVVVLYLVLTIVVVKVNSANILALFVVASPSHHIWNSALINGLAENGHNLTVLSVDNDPHPPKNVHYIHMEGVYDYMYKEIFVDLVGLHNETSMHSVLSLYAFGTVSCIGASRSQGLQRLLSYPNSFKVDLIIYDYTLGPCVLGFLHKFNYPPVVGTTAFNIAPCTVDVIGGHTHYGYIPYLSLNYDMDMNIWQRLHNLWIYAYDYIQRNYYFMPFIDEMAAKTFGPDYPKGSELESKTVLVLVNSHPSIDFPESLPPNVIPVGGLQVRSPANPLSKELNDFINSSVKGSVLFSLGTNVKSEKLSKEMQRMILEAFSRMPQYNFLWKFEGDPKTLPVDVPKNVLIKPWLPQNDILAHHNVKAFITHGGSLSTHEATWWGVPMIGIPFFVDQHRNLHKSIKAGVAESILLGSLTTDKLIETVTKVIETPSYAENMRIRSKRFRDQPEPPLKRAVFWIEYVLRHPNPVHLQSPVPKLGFLRSNLFDIVFLIGFFSCLIIVTIIHLMFKYLHCSESRKTKIE
ncbi:UDP-glucosyltransferase 2 [Pseudolycoriella hygida]|uniref:UDP-glucosyltransferase 2 n=1 Tax=Pseudolycoriella hygida TaxID=35572 RepID=A0A9Q0N9A2_9DIPT|nr:UDP-glucosyltransferase 2 [Pseudolycoriella hygida]